MSTRLNVGMVGISNFAIKEHVPAVRAAGGTLSAFCGLERDQPEQKARQHDVPATYTDYHNLIDDPNIDIVSVCTPSGTHAEIAIAALEAGKHVYLEKPPTTTAKEMRQVVEAARASGTFIYAGSHHLYRENIQYLRKKIEAGALGDIYAIDTLKLRRNAAPIDNGTQTRRGGIALGSTTHRIDVLLYLLGIPEVQWVTARTYNYFVKRAGERKGIERISGLVEDTVIATIHFANGCTATVRDMLDANMQQSADDHGWFGDFTVFGSRAGATLHPLTIYEGRDDGSLAIDVPEVNNDLHAGHTPVYTYFFDCIGKGRKPEDSPERSLLNMRILDAIYDSAEANGRQIAL